MKTNLFSNTSAVKYFYALTAILLFSCSKTSLQKDINSTDIQQTASKTPGPVPNGLCLAPLYEYYSPSDRDHYYTTTLGTYTNYNYSKIVCTVNLCQQGLWQPFYEYYSPSDRDHYYTTTLGTYTNYYYSKIACYVIPAPYTPLNGEIPLYEYYSPSDKDHYYTTILGTYTNYYYSKIAGYVLP
jgi:hypothetical protein